MTVHSVCRNLGANGTKSMLAIPISFVSEHIETLEEIDVEYRELAESVGIEHWGRVPALNTNEVFIKDLANAILEALPSAHTMSVPQYDSLVPSGRALAQIILSLACGSIAAVPVCNVIAPATEVQEEPSSC